MTLPRLDAVAVREYESGGQTRTSFTRIGVALPTKRGDGYTLLLEAIPAPTEGQFRVLLMLGEGLLNKQIAWELGVSEATVKAHMTAIMRKLGASNRTQVLVLTGRLALAGSAPSMPGR